VGTTPRQSGSHTQIFKRNKALTTIIFWRPCDGASWQISYNKNNQMQ